MLYVGVCECDDVVCNSHPREAQKYCQRARYCIDLVATTAARRRRSRFSFVRGCRDATVDQLLMLPLLTTMMNWCGDLFIGSSIVDDVAETKTSQTPPPSHGRRASPATSVLRRACYRVEQVGSS